MPNKPRNGQSVGAGGVSRSDSRETPTDRRARLRARVKVMNEQLDERAKILPSGF